MPYISEAISGLVSGSRRHRKDHLLRKIALRTFPILKDTQALGRTGSLLLWDDGGVQTLPGTTC